ncbi:Multiple RNA-binding domain-containing protein 1, partial [Coemansia sp. RSA 1937]
EAQNAQTYFNNSFIDTSKIEVQIARPHGDATLPRAWSVYTEGTSLYNKTKSMKNRKGEQEKEKLEKEKTQRAIRTLYGELLEGNQEDPRFKEFLQVMAPRAKNRTWTNDDYGNWQTDELAAIRGAVTARREQEDDETEQDRNDGEDGTDEDKTVQEDAHTPEALSDMDWLRMHMNSKLDTDDVEDNVEPEGTAEQKEPVAKPQSKTSDPTAAIASTIAQIHETGRLFVRNLPYMATEDDLRTTFEPFGPLSEVHMPISKDTKRPKGFAYIAYLLPEHAVKAYKALDNKVFLGRLLHVLPGKEKPELRERDDSLGGFKSSVKKERDAKRKAMAGSDFNWNSLFLSADAVADSISERLNISKADLLSADSDGNPAVRLALAETHIVNDAKEYFEQHG